MAKRTITYDNKQFEISYKINSNGSSEFILFLHGWGSNKELMEASFGKCFLGFSHLYLDMPGFGSSTNEYVMDTRGYAGAVGEFLTSLGICPKIIVGHSFGGKVGALLEPRELILLSSAGIVSKKSAKVRLKIALVKLFGRLGLRRFGKIFRTSDVGGMSENMYEVLKLVVNEDFVEVFRSLKSRVSVFWGIDDKTTPLQSGKKIASVVNDCRFFAIDGDHFFFINKGKEIQRLYEGGI